MAKTKNAVDTLLNGLTKKDRAILEAIGLRSADDHSGRDPLKVLYRSFGDPYLDYVTGGGLAVGRMTLLTGWEGTLKSSTALCLCREALESEDRPVAYFDGENSVKEDDLMRFGIDPSRFIYSKDRVVEDVLNAMQAITASGAVSMVVLDSVKSLGLRDAIEKESGAHHIGLKAKRMQEKMNIIMGYAAKHDTDVVIINQFTEDPGAMFGSPERLAGGNWQKYLPELALRLHKAKDSAIFDEAGRKVGQRLGFRIKKSKHTPFEEKETFESNFYYEGGFNAAEGYLRLGLELGFIEKAGSYYTYRDQKVQGKQALKELFLEEKADLFLELKKQCDAAIEQVRNPHTGSQVSV